MDDDAKAEPAEDGTINIDPAKIGNASCVTKFVKTLLSLVSLLKMFNFIYVCKLFFRWSMVLKRI